MTRNTDSLIQELSQNLKPVRSLPRPWTRTAVWIAILIPYVAVVLALIVPRHDLGERVSDVRFLLEQAFALTTGLAAAAAAFASTIPGRQRGPFLWLLLPLAGWLATLGEGCVKAGLTGLTFRHDPRCLLYIIVLGTAPAVVLWLMLRRGAPLTPPLTAALGGLAAAGLGNFCVRLGHPEDVTLMLLVWHVGGVFVLTGLASATGRYLLNWNAITGATRTAGR